jgi:hypothetical protein
MPELPNVKHMLEVAERAAIDGQLSSAAELLRDVARIQEAELGPVHPDLANTLNNLAIIAEKTERFDEAETCYRRAAAIASASLPADHPMVAESRQNLEGFCRERGLPIPAVVTAPPAAQDAVIETESAPTQSARTESAPTESAPTEPATESAPTESAPTESAPIAAQHVPPPVPRRSSRSLAYVAIGAFVLMAMVVFAGLQWSSREIPPDASTAAPAATKPAPPSRPVPAPTEPPPPAKVVTPDSDRKVVTSKPPSARVSGAVSLATAQLCRTFSTSGSTWRCDPAGDAVAIGRPIVMYTRVRSPRDATVVHRWYRGNELQQAVKLTTRANASEGYRTYSRQTVDAVGNWRVEVMSAAGDLLHEQRFTVR